jgi:3-keto-disaccharide hydrolase
MKRRAAIALALFVVLAVLWGTAVGAGDAGAPNTLTEQEKKDGWKLLFDGKTLHGWRVYKKKDTNGWTVKEGAICLEKPGSHDLMTEAKYGNFIFSVDWKFEKGDNSGIIYRLSEQEAEPWMTGPEMQVLNEGPKSKLTKNSSGALYDVYAPKKNALKPRGKWNTFKIVANGKHIEQWVNGEKVVDTDIDSEDWNQRIAKSKWKNNKHFASLPSGHISLQDHGANICFRNIKIKVLRSAGAR